MKEEEDLKEYLAKIRKTIEEGEALVQEAELRIAETDRFLDRQGLTREQVMNIRITEEQRRLVNEELKRRGLPELAEKEELKPFAPEGRVDFDLPDTQGDLDNRRRRFGNMMQEYRL